ncbi:MAG: peptide chain release factor N(5)-glutamine methyltransferase [Methylovulum sp.]|jgi:release factor glutamine methyltransferase|nr:peptide chain release factor N(5)-glutamine methyltransferase [Methylovulum sp.]MCF8007741.1 peptide chain release factor N(5)-glutamine methyltransferase [Methylovulum sp.]
MLSIKTTLIEAQRMLSMHSESAMLDAESLLCHVLNKPRTYLRAWPDTLLAATEFNAFRALIEQRKDGCPVAYLTGKKEFWSHEFIVSPEVLIPRPDTECLIEQCLNLLPKTGTVTILDLGTGSGIIAIILATERPNAQVYATDISLAALTLAQHNATRHHVLISFFHSNWFTALPNIQFDLIVSNPPYIAPNDPHLINANLQYEPQHALIAQENGLADIRQITQTAANFLKPHGFLAFEHGYNQASAVQKILQDSYFINIATHQDLAQLPRVTLGQVGIPHS